MSITTEKAKAASERYLLVRINPARYVLPTLVSGSTYETTFSYPISVIKRNGISLSLVSSLSNDDEYTYDETTGIVQMQLASAPNDTTNVIIVYYYLFYTGTIFRSISEDPEDDATTVRDWQPRISRYPSISQSFDNIINGTFTIQDTDIDIINEDGQFQAYLTDDDSFYNKKIDIWLVISDIANIIKVFTGTVSSIYINQNTVTLSIVDSFNKLNQVAYMGDSVDECLFRNDSTFFTNVDPKLNDTQNPYIVGSMSRFQTITTPLGGATTPAVVTQRLSVATQAVCTNFNSEISTTVNRVWGCCRQKGSLDTQTWGTIEATTTIGDFILARMSTYANVRVGDTIKWTESATDYYGLIYYAGSTFSYSSVNYNLIFSSSSDPFTTSSTIATLKSFAAFIDATADGAPFVGLFYEKDYSISEIATSGANKYIQLTFVNNFEANHSPMTTLSPDNHRLYFRTSNNSVQGHGQLLKDILDVIGIPTNATTFTDADTALTAKCRFHIPNFDEIGFQDYLKYVQDVLASTQGYLRINNDFEAEYYLLEAPTSTDVRDSASMLDGDSSCEIEYRDIATQIIGYNPHYDNYDAIIAAATPSASAKNLKAKHLHDTDNTNRFRHVLDDFSTVINNHIGLQSERACKYNFGTATEDIDTELGDNIQMENKILLGQASSTDLKVVSIIKSPGSIKIRASDMKGL